MTTSESVQIVSLIVDDIKRELAEGLHQAPEEVDATLHFSNMGADSLILLESMQSVNERFGISLSVGDLYENFSSIQKLAHHIYASGNWHHLIDHDGEEDETPMAEPLRAPGAAPMERMNAGVQQDNGSIESIVKRQLEIMEQQLQVMRGGYFPASGSKAAPAKVKEDGAVYQARKPKSTPSETTQQKDRFDAFDFRMSADERARDARKTAYINQLARQLNAKSATSKQLTQQFRECLADNRASAGFRPLLKEMVYPVLSEEASGAYIKDIDGNDYIDFTAGFGTHFFGHCPDFILDRIKARLARGFSIGPQAPEAGKVAQLICELTGNERVTFCNSGTEATMTAVRLGRARTGKEKIVVFRNSYHGTFDGFIARGGPDAKPASQGTPRSYVSDTIVLEYGADDALTTIAEQHADIGAVLVEPVQSRNPALQPAAFLKALRQLTLKHDIALIFDETITGFRCHPGGAQRHFDIQADICTYGKIVGGGMPIGVVAGKARFMDFVDGGPWQFGDSSYPQSPTIFFAGTFSKHPLTMAAALAVLTKLKEDGEHLIAELNARTQALCERLNHLFDSLGVKINARHFSSIFRFESTGNLDVFFYTLMAKGIYIWEGRNCFLSTAHDENVLEKFVTIVKEACDELAPHGLIPLNESVAPSRGTAPAVYAVAGVQKRFVRLHQSNAGGPAGCRVCFGVSFEPGADGRAVDANKLRNALSRVLSAHDGLWFRFDETFATQSPQPAMQAPVKLHSTPVIDDAYINDHLYSLQSVALDPVAGHNLTADIVQDEEGRVLLALCVHHLVCDGWGLTLMLAQVVSDYESSTGTTLQFPSLGEFLVKEQTYLHSPQYETDRLFWQARVRSMLDARTSGNDQYEQDARAGCGSPGARPGDRASVILEDTLRQRVLDKAASLKVTPFVFLLSCFQLFQQRVNPALVTIGIPFANRLGKVEKNIAGNLVNLLPVQVVAPGLAFAQVLEQTRDKMKEAFAHAQYPYDAICELYQLESGMIGSQPGPVDVTFNIEPISQLPALDGCVAKLITPVNPFIEFGQMYNVFLLDDAIRIELDFDCERFDCGDMIGWLRLFQKIIESQI